MDEGTENSKHNFESSQIEIGGSDDTPSDSRTEKSSSEEGLESDEIEYLRKKTRIITG